MGKSAVIRHLGGPGDGKGANSKGGAGNGGSGGERGSRRAAGKGGARGKWVRTLNTHIACFMPAGYFIINHERSIMVIIAL